MAQFSRVHIAGLSVTIAAVLVCRGEQKQMAMIFDMFRASAFVFVLLFVAAISLEVQGRDDESLLLRLVASASSSAVTVGGEETRILDRAFESRKNSDDSCGPQISIETPACDVVGKGNGYELRKYPDAQVSLMYLRRRAFSFSFSATPFFCLCTFCRCFVCCFFLWLVICFKTVCGSCFKAFVCHLVLRKLKSGAAVKLRCSVDQEKPVVTVIYLE
jgi:hypothetical protein